MPNLNYEIKEKCRSYEPVNIYSLMTEVTSFDVSEGRDDKDYNDCDLMYACRVDYNTNYNVRQLAVILEYYEIPRRKLKKIDMINLIICFELNPNNCSKVETRKRLWKHASELKQDNFFTKYLIIEL